MKIYVARNINDNYRRKEEGLWATHMYPNVRRRRSGEVSGASQSFQDMLYKRHRLRED